ncbi:MAG: 8-amino-7-oxononanoate synthase [Pseudomonadota bacterium]|nr:8-amino-7-oxononanoate synthase [Pseudomonadota bacterium]MDP1905148.1 8-amino-7-oxononanoate synthase [Pseudomonadota bacterium]MDP2351905.1 8-amino-7-oxononanoate synthase [Pseudomonadota bacterium]
MLPSQLHSALADLDEQGLRRRRRVLDGVQGARVVLDGREYLSFTSNDYLGLAGHPAIAAAAQAAAAEFGVGAGAAHLLSGHHRLHETLEQELAAFVGMPAALLFSTGYMANLGVIQALLDRHGEVFEDRLNHASLVDAALLSRAKLSRYPHLDLVTLERQLAASSARVKLIASDTVFSMDGDLAPVAELLALAEKYDAWLYLDDAHGFGVLGEAGEGATSLLTVPVREGVPGETFSPLFQRGAGGDLRTSERAQPLEKSPPAPLLQRGGQPPPRLIYLATLGKAAGVSGAFVAGSDELVEWLVNKARTYIYTTAQPPLLAAAVSASLKLIAAEPWRRRRLAELVARLKAGMAGLPWTLLASDTPIQPLLVGDAHASLALADGLRQRGILIPAIRPPTVPNGTARLRVSLSAAHTVEDVDELLAALRALAVA